MRKHDLTVQYAHPLQLTLHPKNARKGVVPKIKESLLRFGQYRPIVVSKRSNYVLAGNHTLKAIMELNWGEVAYVLLDVDEETEQRILLADNRLADLGDYDLDTEIDLLQGLNGDYVGTGYDAAYLDMLMSELNAGPDRYDEEDLDDESDRPVRFDVMIHCRDRVEQMAVLNKLDDLGIAANPVG